MDFTRILKQPQRDRMHGRIPPPLVEEPPGPVKMVEIVFIRLTPPKLHIRDFEIAPEMTGRVAVCFLIMVGPALLVFQPSASVHRVVLEVFGMCFGEAQGFGPEGGDGFGVVVEVDGEAVGFVVVLHVAENIVIDVAEEVDFGLHSPVVADVFQGRMVVEHAAVPATHLVVGEHGAVLDFLLLEHLTAFFDEVVVYPGGDGPVFFGDKLVAALCFCFGLGAGFEFFCEGDVVEEGPGVVEFVVPGSFEVSHGSHHAFYLFVAHKREDSSVYARGIGVVGGIFVGSP